MAKVKHIPGASEKISDYIATLPDWSRKICNRLRDICIKSDPKIIEDWKWGPNYYLQGMVCGFAGSKKHVNFVFFRGTQLKDKKKILQGNPDNLNIRTLKFKDIKEINEDLLLEYIMEAIDNNVKGLKPVKAGSRSITVPAGLKKELKKAGVLSLFEKLPYSHKKEYIAYIESAKKPETRIRRVEKTIDLIRTKSLAKSIKK